MAVIPLPDILILDEPTSGVDPQARDAFWDLLLELARIDEVAIFISTHFMDEGMCCDRISLMHAGQILVSDTPKALTKARGVATLGKAFIAHIPEVIPPGDAAATTLTRHLASALGSPWFQPSGPYAGSGQRRDGRWTDHVCAKLSAGGRGGCECGS